jgi:hypothetical protein
MPSKKSNSRMSELEAQRKATERHEQRTRRWQQIVFIVISVIVLLSMVITLFIHP